MPKDKIDKVAKDLGIHRRELHVFMFNAEEGSDNDYDKLLEGLKKKGYDYETFAWDNDGPPAPPNFDYEDEDWYERTKAKVLKYIQ